MKNSKSKISPRDLATETFAALFFNSPDQNIFLAQLKDKLICGQSTKDCYYLIDVYSGTKIEDVAWDALNVIDKVNNLKLNRILVS
jgi:hypothetical protein